ncbi:MAG: hypothetical protein ABW168_02895, partial [Sedimenticola sp.]
LILWQHDRPEGRFFAMQGAANMRASGAALTIHNEHLLIWIFKRVWMFYDIQNFIFLNMINHTLKRYATFHY